MKGECAAHDDLLAVPNMRHAFILIDAISILYLDEVWSLFGDKYATF